MSDKIKFDKPTAFEYTTDIDVINRDPYVAISSLIISSACDCGCGTWNHDEFNIAEFIRLGRQAFGVELVVKQAERKS